MRAAAASAWQRLAGHAALEREVREELSAHIDALAREYVAAGHGEADSLRLAHERFGDLDAHVEACLSERWNGGRPMRTALTLVALLLTAALLMTLAHSRALRARENAARAEQYELMARLADLQREAREPKPLVFQVGDTLHVTDALHPDRIDVEVEVVTDGMILLPELGWVTAHGMERSALEATLNQRYREYFEDTRITVAPEGAVQAK